MNGLNYTNSIGLCVNLYLSDKLSDMKFVFKEKNEATGAMRAKVITIILAHEFPLASSSPVFRVMFNGKWEKENEVKIVD